MHLVAFAFSTCAPVQRHRSGSPRRQVCNSWEGRATSPNSAWGDSGYSICSMLRKATASTGPSTHSTPSDVRALESAIVNLCVLKPIILLKNTFKLAEKARNVSAAVFYHCLSLILRFHCQRLRSLWLPSFRRYNHTTRTLTMELRLQLPEPTDPVGMYSYCRWLDWCCVQLQLISKVFSLSGWLFDGLKGPWYGIDRPSQLVDNNALTSIINGSDKSFESITFYDNA